MIKQILIGAMLLCGSGSIYASNFVVDQHNDSGITSQGYTNQFGELGQSFSPTANWLDHVELRLNAQTTTPTTAHIEIWKESDFLNGTGSALGTSQSVSLAYASFGIAHFEFAAINISSYSSLFIRILSDATIGAATSDGHGVDSYAGGATYITGASCCQDGYQDDDLWFRTGHSAVPVPAAVWLFGSGLVGLIGASRRKAMTA